MTSKSVAKFCGNYGAIKNVKNKKSGEYFLITIPKKVSKKLGLKTGDNFSVDFIEDTNQIIYTRKDI